MGACAQTNVHQHQTFASVEGVAAQVERSKTIDRAVSLVLLVAAIAATVMSCSSANSSEKGDVVDAYAQVIRWFVERAPSGADTQLVFVEARGEGLGIDLDVQAAVVKSTQSVADVRFIDDRSEAIQEDQVRDGGILLAIGPAVVDGRSATIECDEYRDVDVAISRRFSLVFAGGEWVVRGEPTVLTD